jgi:hypothetical protein
VKGRSSGCAWVWGVNIWVVVCNGVVVVIVAVGVWSFRSSSMYMCMWYLSFVYVCVGCNICLCVRCVCACLFAYVKCVCTCPSVWIIHQTMQHNTAPTSYTTKTDTHKTDYKQTSTDHIQNT